MRNRQTQELLEQELDSFNPEVRHEALEVLVDTVRRGGIVLPPRREEVNLHYHTFHSFNAKGWSPSRVCWEATKYGLEIAGIIDFDTLAGMEEFLTAGKILGQNVVVGLETRVFVAEMADKVTNSPNEPGIAYSLATGCHKLPTPGSEAELTLKSMAQMARLRNEGMVDRVNAYLGDVQLDYAADVLPLTPLGNATERHMLIAYDHKAREIFKGDSEKTAEFWSAKLGASRAEMLVIQEEQPKFHDLMRKKLMKFGGIGYAAPESGSFPSLDQLISMIKQIDAVPVIAWLDGTSEGENDANALVEFFISKGAEALSIVPDRNWNINDQAQKNVKLSKLAEIVQVSDRRDLPIMIGTEMNQAGQPFVDDFSAPELEPHIPLFLQGARRIHERSLSSLQ